MLKKERQTFCGVSGVQDRITMVNIEESTDVFKHIRVFVPDKSDIKLIDRIILGFLVFRDKIGQTPSQRQIAQELGQHLSLVERAMGRLEAIGVLTGEPADGLFRTRRTAPGEPDHWTTRLQYVTTYLPAKDSPVTLKHAAIWSLFKSRPDVVFGIKSLASYASCNRNAADEIVQDLQKLELVKTLELGWGKGFKISSIADLEFAGKYFQKHELRTKPKSQQPVECEYAKGSDAEYIYQRCRNNLVPIALSGECADLAAAAGLRWKEFDIIWEYVTSKNDRTKFDHPGFLLRSRLATLKPIQQPEPLATEPEPEPQQPEQDDNLDDDTVKRLVTKFHLEKRTSPANYVLHDLTAAANYANWTRKQTAIFLELSEFNDFTKATDQIYKLAG